MSPTVRKVIKILGKVISAAVLLLIILPVLLALVLDIPVVQNYVVHKAAAIVSRKLETTVSIGRVTIGLFNKLKADDVYVEDYQKDTLLYAGHVEAFVSHFGFAGGGLVLGRAEVQDAKFYLRETPSGEMNIKQITDRLSNKDKPSKGSFKLTITSASIDNMDFCLESLEHKDPPHGIDFSHMHLFGIRARVSDLTIEGSTIHTLIRSLSCRERSGFVLDDLKGRFYLSSGCLGFEELTLRTGKSALDIPEVSLVGNSWAEYKDFLGEVRIAATIRQSILSTDDVSFFAPQLRDWHTTFNNIDLSVEGTVSDFTASVSRLEVGADTQIAVQAAVRGLPDIQHTYFDLDIERLTTSLPDIDRLALGIAHKKLPDKLLKMLRNSGRLDLTGDFAGTFASFRMQTALATGLGRVNCDLQVKPLKDGRRRVLGGVGVQNVRLGELLSNSRLGDVTLAVRVDGAVGRGYVDAGVTGGVSKFGFNGYVYDSLKFDGRMFNREFNGRVTARDPNLDFDFTGMVDLNDSVPRYDFSLDLRKADLVKMRINPRDSVSVLSARLVANAAGRSFDDLNGDIRITDASYRYNDRQIQTAQITVRGENTANSKFVELRSDFLDVTFRSKTSYREVFEYLKMSVWKYLPMIYDKDKYVSPDVQETVAANDYSLLSVQVKKIAPVMNAIADGLQIADGSQLQLLFNPAGDKLSLKVSSEYVEQGDRLLATKINVNAANHGDSLAFYAASEDFYLGALHLRNLSLAGGAREGRLQLSTGFNDTLSRMSGLFGFTAALAPVPGPNGRVLDVRILPSHLTRGDKTWQVYARRIQLDTAQVVIDDFYVMNDQQDLLIDGVASRSQDDSVQVRLRNFDLAPFSQLVDRIGYVIEGVTNGTATIKSALRGSEITADIRFDSLKVNDIPVPSLRLVSKWDFQGNRAGFFVQNRLKRDTLIQGFYAPAEVRYYARVTVDSLDVGLLDPVLRGVISDTKGLAKADLVFKGQRREAELRGSVEVSGLSTKVDFTQVVYSVPRVMLEVKNNRFQMRDVPIYDPEGNRGGLDFELSLDHLSNIAYKVRVTPNKMLVLNTTSQDNDLFYGRVYATGTASISGDKRGVFMDIAATTDDNSSFNLPLSNRSNISYANFVTFAEPKMSDSTNYLARKKMLFERHRVTKTAAESMMNISLALDVKPNLDFQMEINSGNVGNQIRARGEGALNLQINPRRNIFEMYGDYVITEGTYNLSLENIITRKFSIESGSTILWTGSPMNAMLNIDAVYRLKTSLTPLLQGTTNSVSGDRSVPVECVIHLGDRLTNPAIKFDVRVPSADAETQAVIANALSSPETVDTQFAYLLIFNSFQSETSGANANIGVSASAATGLEFLSGQLSKWLSNDDYNVVIRYRPKSELTSDEVDFGLSKSLINNRLFVEVEGNYIVDNKQAVNRNMSNFMGEAYITWHIDRSGNLRLRGFTQTIDRFDENQGLQETGIGIYYKEDFNNLKDLRRRIKDRFTNKERKARREARKQAEAEATTTQEPESEELQEPPEREDTNEELKY